ncbi:hypothetical protein CAC42_1961 [Sphaceloma murrayae]|uniref:Uncharacterized protein n=1 Tax=Sphaceloma murrayae TaxID=2082308 RepID=A0A2K1QM21_9PEZI|nr:hypothetical protein CAC42_1961 [Sphaceloma murrayae]
MRLSILALPALVAAAPAPAAWEDIKPDPTQVQITGLTYGGTGCPQGTVASVISADRTYMTLIFDSYVASYGPDVAITENRKNCQLNVGLRYPGGFQYSLFSADYRGYAALDKGVTGTQKSTYYFSGQTQQTSTQTDFYGPISKDYLINDKAESTSVIWSPCGAEGLLNINSQVRLTSTDKKATGVLTTDSVDTKFKQILYLQWKKC